MYRDHTCGELNGKSIGQQAKLAGWVQSRRDHGGIIFIDLRDRYGLTQIVIDPLKLSEGDKLRREWVISVSGKIRMRPEGMKNPKMKTGEIEVDVLNLEILNSSETPPFEIDDRIEASEEMRLKYRYLDLRRPVMQRNLLFRHRFVSAIRSYLNAHEFIEIETPILVKPTPEGARDYVVPSRVNVGKFYALPQSPQLYKQILMVAGMDRYYQIARCLRDEDLRADRQPEHSQIDLEMSFLNSDEIRQFIESMIHSVFKEVMGIQLDKFKMFSFKESMERFGSDKPDIRFGMEIIDVSDILKKSNFDVFKNAECAKCINPERDFSRKEMDEYIEFTKVYGAKGMAWARVIDGKLESSIVKYLSDDVQKELIAKTKAKNGSVLMFIAEKKRKCESILGFLRNKLRDDLGLVKGKEKEFAFCWIKDFPLFAFNEEEQKWEPEHHMFSKPRDEFVNDFEKRPGEVLGDLWDLALNGVEVSSGSIRISNPELQERIMKFIGIEKEAAYKKFGFLLESYKYGGPVHGGMGIGIDRLVAMMLSYNDIREVIAFPKNKAAECPMDGSPSDLDEKQLKELHLKLDITVPKK